MIVKKSDMVEDAQLTSSIRRFLLGAVSYGNSSIRLSTASVDQLFQEYRDRNIKREFFKGVRPWEFINFRDRHPDADMMIGVEIEVGFSSDAALTEAYTFLMDECEYSTADIEGYGMYPLEATFPPVPADQLLADDCQITRYYDTILKKQKIIWRPSDMIGTHFNVSFKGISAMDIHTLRAKAENFNELVLEDGGSGYCCPTCHGSYSAWLKTREENPGVLAPSAKKKLFGRLPYGGAYVQTAGVNRWIELKLFNSTNNINKMRWYKEVALAIGEWFRSDSTDPKDMLFELADRSPMDGRGRMRRVSAAVATKKEPTIIITKKEKAVARPRMLRAG